MIRFLTTILHSFSRIGVWRNKNRSKNYKFSIPNFAISSIIGNTFSPSGVREYSTLGGTSGYCFFLINYPVVDLEDDEQCPLSGENLHRLSYGTFIV